MVPRNSLCFVSFCFVFRMRRHWTIAAVGCKSCKGFFWQLLLRVGGVRRVSAMVYDIQKMIAHSVLCETRVLLLSYYCSTPSQGCKVCHVDLLVGGKGFALFGSMFSEGLSPPAPLSSEQRPYHHRPV